MDAVSDNCSEVQVGVLWPERALFHAPGCDLQVASFPGVFLDRFNLKTSSDVSDTMLGLAFAQIDSMHSQAYYPVLLQRAPPMPSEVGYTNVPYLTSAMPIICQASCLDIITS